MADCLRITAADHIFYGEIPERGPMKKTKPYLGFRPKIEIIDVRVYDEPAEFVTEHLTGDDAESLRLLDEAEVYYLQPVHVIAVWCFDGAVHLYNPHLAGPDYDQSGQMPYCFSGLMQSLPIPEGTGTTGPRYSRDDVLDALHNEFD